MAANGVEISTAYLSLLVRMPGVQKSINQAVGRVDISSSAKKLGEQISAGVGKTLKSQVAKKFADATAAALEQSTTATKKLSDAEHALVRARATHGTSAAKITAAEEKLDSLRKSGKASTGDLEKAEAALSKAQADAATTRRGVEAASVAVASATRDAKKATEEYNEALRREKSSGERALEWMPLANARLDEIANKWQKAGAKITGIGDSLTTYITKPAVVAGGAVSSLIGALGFKRLVGIDTARGQFKGLGMDADKVMQQVDLGVTNTSLSMAQGASLAVGILATGSVPLQGLEAQIKRVANVSAAYNVDSEHAAYLLNNVLTKNKVTWGDLSQMQMNQIPIVTQLADYYGVAGDEIMKMAQDGKISVADMNAALDKNAGAAALEYAKTWKGVTANIMSNLSKIGAKFLEPTFQIIKEEAAKFLEVLKSPEFSKFATDIGNKVGGMARELSAKIQQLVGWWNGLSESQKGLIGKTVALAIAMGPVLKIVGLLTGGIGAMIRTGQVLVGLYTGWTIAADKTTAATTGQSIAMKIQEGASKRSVAAMKAGVVVQNLLNAAIWKSPITWIVAGIVALIAGLVLFFTKTKVGKEIWANFTKFLGEAWANVSAFFKQVWESVLKPVFDGIGRVATWVFENVLKPAFDAVVTAFTWIGNVFQAIWTGFLKPVFEGIAAVAKWVFEYILFPIFKVAQLAFAVFAGVLQGIWDFILKPVFEAIGAVFKWLWDTIISVVVAYIEQSIKVWGAIFTWLWENVLSPIFQKIGEIFNWIYTYVIQPIILGIQIYIKMWAAIFTWLWQTIIKPIFDAIGRIFTWILNTIIKPIVGQIQANIRAAGAVFTWLYQNAIKPAWDAISNVISTVWNKGIKPVIDTLVKVIQSDPKKAFEAARDAIGVAWKGIQDLAKQPVKFVVNTVINGLIDAVNGFGLKIPHVKLPKGFAGGGVLPGYMAQKRDDVLMPMRSGEGVLVPEVVRGLGAGFVHSLNAVGNTGGAGAVRSKFGHIGAGLARGGLVDPLPKGSWSQSQAWGNAGHNGLDMAAPSGTKVYAAASGVVRLAGPVPMGGNEIYIQHTNGLGTRYSHLSRFASKAGQPVRQGQVIGYVGSTGMSTGPHLHYMVHNPGLGPGSYYPNVNPAAYLGAQGKDLGVGAGLLDGFIDGATDQIKKAFPGGGFFVDVAAGMAKKAVKDLTGVFTGMFGNDTGHTGTDAYLYDSGGWLMPGQVAVNRTKRPEPILTDQQWDDVRGMRRAAAGGPAAAEGPVQAVFYDTDGVLIGTIDGRIQKANGQMGRGPMRRDLGLRG